MVFVQDNQTWYIQMNIHDVTYANDIATAKLSEIRQFLNSHTYKPGRPKR